VVLEGVGRLVALSCSRVSAAWWRCGARGCRPENNSSPRLHCADVLPIVVAAADGRPNLLWSEDMKASWNYYPPEDADGGALWALVREDGEVLSETDSRPTAAGNRELAREWDVEIV